MGLGALMSFGLSDSSRSQHCPPNESELLWQGEFPPASPPAFPAEGKTAARLRSLLTSAVRGQVTFVCAEWRWDSIKGPSQQFSECFLSEPQRQVLELWISKVFWVLGIFSSFLQQWSTKLIRFGQVQMYPVAFDCSGLINIDIRHLHSFRTALSWCSEVLSNPLKPREASDFPSNQEPDWSYLVNFSCCHLSVSVLPRFQSRIF